MWVAWMIALYEWFLCLTMSSLFAGRSTRGNPQSISGKQNLESDFYVSWDSLLLCSFAMANNSNMFWMIVCYKESSFTSHTLLVRFTEGKFNIASSPTPIPVMETYAALNDIRLWSWMLNNTMSGPKAAYLALSLWHIQQSRKGMATCMHVLF